MIDSGSDATLLRHDLVAPDIPRDKLDVLFLRGITSKPLITLGSVSVVLLGKAVKFHLMPDDFTLPYDGILGTDFFTQAKAIIDYEGKCVRLRGIHIPFAERTVVVAKARTVTPFFANIVNPERQCGYIPPLISIPGVHLGDAIVTNSNGRAYLPLFNTKEEEYDIEVPSVLLREFDTVETLSDLDQKLESTDPVAVDARGHVITDGLCGSTLPLRPLSNSAASASIQSINDNCSVTSSDSQDRINTILALLRLDHLNSEERESVERLIREHPDRFHLPYDNLEATTATEHYIPTIDKIPIHTKQYRFPPVHKEEISRQVNDLLNDQLIENSTSPYNSPLWIVPKKPDSLGNKRWRLVIDYRALNQKTIGDAYPLPNITDILDQLGSAKYFSVLDLASGFHQIPVAKEDAPKTAFSTSHGHYQFLRMPFGLKNAPATFQRLMDTVLSGLQGNELFVYMDDIVIYAKSLREHEVKFD